MEGIADALGYTVVEPINLEGGNQNLERLIRFPDHKTAKSRGHNPKASNGIDIFRVHWGTALLGWSSSRSENCRDRLQTLIRHQVSRGQASVIADASTRHWPGVSVDDIELFVYPCGLGLPHGVQYTAGTTYLVDNV